MATTEFSPNPEVPQSPQFHSFNRRCCFCIPYKWQKINPSPSPSLSHSANNTFWSRSITALKKLREWSEIVAGPKWKTFIRRFNRSKSNNNQNHHHHHKFQYDPIDYALNFDQGVMEINGDEELEQEYIVRNFSSRYALRTPQPIASKTTPFFDQGNDNSGPNFV